MKQFKLMTSLYAHTGDVKSLCPTRDPGDFVSVSRDLNAKLWHCQNSETSNQYIQSQTITTHKKYVNAVVVVYSLVEYPNGLIITGSNDQTISIHDIESNANIAQLKEHDGAVCTLYFDNSSQRNLLYSGSFDSSAKVWNLNDLVKSDFKLTSIFTIKEHSHTVWSVMAIEKRQILLTGSADKTIKQFRIDPVNRTYDFQFKYAGHSDCVRGLCVNTRNDNEFFSCSNDGSVIQWRLDSPTPLRQIPVTGSFLYSINALRFQEDDGKGSCHVITSGEDRSLRIHKIGPNSIDMLQCLVMPCQTLWYAVELGNGNLAVACSDGTIRLFTQKDQLMASKGEVESFEKELSNFAISIKTDEKLAEIKLNDLPGVEALEIPGKRDGQSIVVNNNNEAEVYQWDAEGMRWVKIGVAVGSSQTGGGSRSKVSYLGKEYDYVFDIELDDTKASLKLPYNVSEDPYHAAQKFIHKHELSQMFLDQIAQFIINNTQSETIGDSKAGKTYYDPFTGENRYVPPAGNSGSTNGSQSTYSDPFTGSGAYKTSYENVNQSEVSKPSRKNEYFPHLDFILFDQINSEAILRKAKEFQQKSNQTTGDLAKFEFLVNNLDKVKSEADFASEIQSLFEMISTWPKELKFPLIDLIRISVLNRKVADHILESPSFVRTLFSQINADSPINSMLVAKVLCNMFKGFIDSKVSDPKLALFLLTERHNIIKSLHELSTTENKSFQIAFSTLLLNYVVLIKQLANSKTSLDLNASNLNEIMIEFVQYFSELSNLVLNWDPEATFRILVAFGTIVSKTDSLLDYELIVTLAKSLEGFKITCQDINAKPGNFAPKISSTAAFLLKELN